ncbi:MAG: glycerol dehydrogenase [Chitinophagales bacterium]
MRKAFISPSKYVQGEGELRNLGYFISCFGKTALLVASQSGYERVKKALNETALKFDVSFVKTDFCGECSKAEIARLDMLARDNGCDCVIGLGGGKAIDTAKCVANGKPLIIVPTNAATDAPTSHLSVIYNQDGAVEELAFFPKNPDVVLVDTDVIAKSPARLLVSGMGDALATFFEARSCGNSFKEVWAGYPCGAREEVCPPAKPTRTAMALARLCYETLLADGLKAKQACELNIVTPALENVVEANTLLSGLGFENGGLAAAHAIHDALTTVPETHAYYHGEKVAFGTICQLVLENAPKSEIETVIRFLLEVGLPVCLEEIGIKSLSNEKLTEISMAACQPGSNMHNMPFPVKPNMVAAAVLAADRIGRTYKSTMNR